MMIKNSMIIQNNDGSKQRNICPACIIDYMAEGQASINATVPIFYTRKHAYDEGWRKTTHHWFSKNGNAVWVCPDCCHTYNILG